MGISGIRARELELRTSRIGGANLFVKGKNEKKYNSPKNHQTNNQEPKGKKKNKQYKNKDSDKECYHCGKMGHLKKNCYKFIREQKNEGSATVAAEKGSMCLSEALTVSSDHISREWILDSGCSFHMSPYRDWFVNFRNSDQGTVYMGNDNTCRIQGVGDITLKLHDGKVRILTDVRYVLDLKRNLISLGTLDELGFTYKAHNGNMHISKGNKLILTGIKRNGLYVLNGQHVFSDKPISALTSNVDMTNI